MKSLYNYLYYRSYDLLSLTGKFDLAFGASHLLSIMCTLVIQFLLLKVGVHDEAGQFTFILSSLFLFAIIHLINYSAFLKQNRYKAVIDKFRNESKGKMLIARTLSIILMISLMYSLF